jgi:predicted metal-dependent hydrolase
MAGLFRRSGGKLVEKAPEPALLEIGDTQVTLAFRRNMRARRLIIRPSRDGRSFIVTMPPRVNRSEAIDFAERSRRWMVSRLRSSPSPIGFAPGARIMFRGSEYTIVHRPVERGSVWRGEADASLNIAGDIVHLPRRLADWLKQEAKRDLTRASLAYSQAMAVTFRRITVRDQSSRWGSCSADGNLSFSWRLVLAPAFVLDYVAAHEVAHLRHMNHGVRYWRLLLSHCPHAKDAETWLRRYGGDLHRYGAQE